MKKTVWFLPLVLLIIIPAFADDVPTYPNVDNNWTWASQGNTPIRLDSNFAYSNVQTATGYFQCHVMGNLSGHTIHSIDGVISIFNNGQNVSKYSTNDVDSVFIFITNSTYGYTTNGGKCADANNVVMPGTAMYDHNMIRIGPGQFITDSLTAQTIPYNLDGIEIYVPTGWHILVVGYGQSSQTTGTTTIHEQLIAYMS